jgi:hypothetical protein
MTTQVLNVAAAGEAIGMEKSSAETYLRLLEAVSHPAASCLGRHHWVLVSRGCPRSIWSMLA